MRATISCVICDALYTLAPSYAYLLQTQPMLLEPMFMSTCHFCFCCRRPACPGCWDAVHGVCGSCGQKACLPFRITLPPLRGTLFTSPREVQPTYRRANSDVLVCARAGHFESDALLSIDVLPMSPVLSAVTMPPERVSDF